MKSAGEFLGFDNIDKGMWIDGADQWYQFSFGFGVDHGVD